MPVRPVPINAHTLELVCLRASAVLPLTKQLSVVSGSLWSKTLQGARAQRIEMLLLHEFHDRKFILPDKLTARDKAAQVAAQASKNAAKGKGAKGKKAEAKAAAGDAGAAGGEDEVRSSFSSNKRHAARDSARDSLLVCVDVLVRCERAQPGCQHSMHPGNVLRLAGVLNLQYDGPQPPEDDEEEAGGNPAAPTGA
jgi:hypothetical protein